MKMNSKINEVSLPPYLADMVSKMLSTSEKKHVRENYYLSCLTIKQELDKAILIYERQANKKKSA